MSMVAEAAEPERQTVGKKRLCELLQWSRMRLDRRLEEDERFPVVTRGTQAGGWAFDYTAVRAYLDGEGAEAEDEPDDAEEEDSRPRGHVGEQTARQRRDTVQAQLLEDKLRKQRGEIVETADLRMRLGEAVTALSTTLNSMPDVLVRRLNLPEQAGAIIRQEIEEARRRFVVGLRDMFTDE